MYKSVTGHNGIKGYNEELTRSDEVCLDEPSAVCLNYGNVDISVQRRFRNCIQLFDVQIAINDVFAVQTKSVVRDQG